MVLADVNQQSASIAKYLNSLSIYLDIPLLPLFNTRRQAFNLSTGAFDTPTDEGQCWRPELVVIEPGVAKVKSFIVHLLKNQQSLHDPLFRPYQRPRELRHRLLSLPILRPTTTSRPGLDLNSAPAWQRLARTSRSLHISLAPNRGLRSGMNPQIYPAQFVSACS